MITLNSIFEVSAPISSGMTAVARYDSSRGKTFVTFSGSKHEILYWLQEFAKELENT